MAFTEATVQFLSDLRLNNDRDWFQPRKPQYEELVRTPMSKFVEALNSELSTYAPDYVTDPPKAIYRIYRDTRFSSDKTPYKTHIGALFPHRRLGKDAGAAFYFHLSPEELLIAGGLYHTPAPQLVLVRSHIAHEYQQLTKILSNRSVRQFFGMLQGDRLSRPPKGWPADHPAIEYLRYKDLLLEVALRPEQGLGKSAYKDVAKRFRAMAPLISFLNEPLLAERRRQRQDPLTSL